MIKWKKTILDLKPMDLPIVSELKRKYNHSKIIKLNYNESAFGPTSNVLKIENIKHLNRYPSFMYKDLGLALSKKYNLPSDVFYVASGSDFILSNLLNLLELDHNSEVIIPALTFARIEITCDIYNLNKVKVDLNDGKMNLQSILDKINKNTKAIYLVNPNMPTGGYCSMDDIVTFMEQVPNNIVVILDEAYIEFAIGFEMTFKNNKKLINRFNNLIITHTFSKVFGLANLRIGYAIADREIINVLKNALPPFLISDHSMNMALLALDDLVYYDNVIKKINEEKEYLYSEFDKLDLDYIKSYGNFIFVYTRNFKNKDIYNHLLVNFGVLIRCIKDIGLRITVGTHEENLELIKGIKDFLNV